MPPDRILKLLNDLRAHNSDRYDLVQALRQVIHDLNPNLGEEVKYGGLLFSTTQAFCGIFAYTQHVSLEFGDGASLPDKFRVLEGKGKLRRHIKLISIDDLATKHVKEYLLLAIKASAQSK